MFFMRKQDLTFVMLLAKLMIFVPMLLKLLLSKETENLNKGTTDSATSHSMSLQDDMETGMDN